MPVYEMTAEELLGGSALVMPASPQLIRQLKAARAAGTAKAAKTSAKPRKKKRREEGGPGPQKRKPGPVVRRSAPVFAQLGCARLDHGTRVLTQFETSFSLGLGFTDAPLSPAPA